MGGPLGVASDPGSGQLSTDSGKGMSVFLGLVVGLIFV